MNCEGFKTAPRASGSALSADCQTGGSKSAVTPVPIFDLRVGQIVKSSVSFGVPKMPACDKIRPTSISGSPQVTNKCLFYNYARERPEICNVGLLDNDTQKSHQRTI